MEKQESTFIDAVDHIISIEIDDWDSTTRGYNYHPAVTLMEREKWWKKKKPVDYPAGYGEYGPGDPWFIDTEYYPDIYSYLRSLKDERYMIKEFPGKKKPHDKKIVYRPKVKFTLVGGKYTRQKTIYFDEYEDAVEYVENLVAEVPGKFTIIRNPKNNEDS